MPMIPQLMGFYFYSAHTVCATGVSAHTVCAADDIDAEALPLPNADSIVAPGADAGGTALLCVAVATGAKAAAAAAFIELA